MYKSPVTIDHFYESSEPSEAEKLVRKVVADEEAYIMYRVRLEVDVDKEELIKALQYDREQYEKGYADAMLHCYERGVVEVVPCKDCKRWEQNKNLPYGYCSYHCSLAYATDWCSWAERRDDGEIH